MKKIKIYFFENDLAYCAHQDLNPQPLSFEPTLLTARTTSMIRKAQFLKVAAEKETKEHNFCFFLQEPFPSFFVRLMESDLRD